MSSCHVSLYLPHVPSTDQSLLPLLQLHQQCSAVPVCYYWNGDRRGQHASVLPPGPCPTCCCHHQRSAAASAARQPAEHSGCAAGRIILPLAVTASAALLANLQHALYKLPKHMYLFTDPSNSLGAQVACHKQGLPSASSGSRLLGPPEKGFPCYHADSACLLCTRPRVEVNSAAACHGGCSCCMMYLV